MRSEEITPSKVKSKPLSDFVTKPLTRSELEKHISEILRRYNWKYQLTDSKLIIMIPVKSIWSLIGFILLSAFFIFACLSCSTIITGIIAILNLPEIASILTKIFAVLISIALSWAIISLVTAKQKKFILSPDRLIITSLKGFGKEVNELEIPIDKVNLDVIGDILVFLVIKGNNEIRESFTIAHLHHPQLRKPLEDIIIKYLSYRLNLFNNTKNSLNLNIS